VASPWFWMLMVVVALQAAEGALVRSIAWERRGQRTVGGAGHCQRGQDRLVEGRHCGEGVWWAGGAVSVECRAWGLLLCGKGGPT
jgi:hypothetical protein